MKINAVIFDLDGVLVHTDEFHYQAWKALADRIGVYFDKSINNRLRGISRMESLNIILENYEGSPFSPEEKERLAEEKNEIYLQLLTTMNPQDVAEDIRHTLTYLKNQGIKLAIGSSSKNAKFILEQVELKTAFDAISDGNNITNSKPDPEVFLKAADYLSVPPEECLVVEDAYAGIDAARAGGMLSAAIGDASSYDKADYVLDSVSSLTTLPIW